MKLWHWYTWKEEGIWYMGRKNAFVYVEKEGIGIRERWEALVHRGWEERKVHVLSMQIQGTKVLGDKKSNLL